MTCRSQLQSIIPLSHITFTEHKRKMGGGDGRDTFGQENQVNNRDLYNIPPLLLIP